MSISRLRRKGSDAPKQADSHEANARAMTKETSGRKTSTMLRILQSLPIAAVASRWIFQMTRWTLRKVHLTLEVH